LISENINSLFEGLALGKLMGKFGGMALSTLPMKFDLCLKMNYSFHSRYKTGGERVERRKTEIEGTGVYLPAYPFRVDPCNTDNSSGLFLRENSMYTFIAKILATQPSEVTCDVSPPISIWRK